MEQIRLSPSGPVLGTLSATPLRVNEDVSNLDAALVLDGSLQDIDADLRAELAGPFIAGHYFSAECDIDVANGSTNAEAVVQVYLQISYNGGTFVTVHSEVHTIGANGTGELRQVQPVRFHAPPTVLSSWGTLPAAPTTMAVRAAALLFAGEEDEVAVQVTENWIRLTEHSAP